MGRLVEAVQRVMGESLILARINQRSMRRTRGHYMAGWQGQLRAAGSAVCSGAQLRMGGPLPRSGTGLRATAGDADGVHYVGFAYLMLQRVVPLFTLGP